MTREERKKFRLVERELKKAIREACKRHKYKTVGGWGYKVVNGYIYDLSIIVVDKGETLKASVSGKPLAMDELFWEVFGIQEEVKNQPLSFHIRAAFVPYSLTLDDWKCPLASLEKMDDTLDDIFIKTEETIAKYEQEFQDIENYKKAVEQKEHLKLNVILCDMLQGRYKETLEYLERELAGETGPFLSVSGGSIYELAKQYCQKMLEAQ